MEASSRQGKRTRAAFEEAQPSYISGHHHPYEEYERQKRAAYIAHYNNGYRNDASPPWRKDDRDGHFVFELGENITPRYKILAKIGEGTFGQVLECWDRKYCEYVAIKIIRNIPKYRDAAEIEVEVLHVIARHDKEGVRGCLRMKEWFDYRGHICIVCERLGPSLYDYLKKNHYRPFPTNLVRDIGRQLLYSVAYLHDLSLIHTDLKPENILLLSSEYNKVPDLKADNPDKHVLRWPKSSRVRLIDFGSATFANRHHSSIVSTRQYRAPEIILGMGWSFPCDIWSIGCILVELVSGEALFQTHENIEHLAMMERVLGPIPRNIMSNASKRSEKYFRNRRELHWPEGASSPDSIQAVRSLLRLKEIVESCVCATVARPLTQLLEGMLTYDPVERITAKEALAHPFFDTTQV